MSVTKLTQATLVDTRAVFRVRAAARTEAGTVFVREAVAAVDAAGEPYTFYSWKRGEAAAPPRD